MSKQFDLAVAWRIYPEVSKKPIIHSNNKLNLVATCLQSFKQSVEGLVVSYYFILDGCMNEYDQLIESIFNNNQMQIIHTNKIGNMATFDKQIEVLLKQDDADLVYFAEDDYLYVPNQFARMIKLVKYGKADFASVYVHNDIFNHLIHNHKRDILYFEDDLWFTASSTCLTFLTTVKNLSRTKNVFKLFSLGKSDCVIWLILTQEHIFKISSWWKYRNNKECFGMLKNALKYYLMYNFSFSTKSTKYKLWIPWPAIGTHLESGLESPSYNWINLATQIDEKLCET